MSMWNQNAHNEGGLKIYHYFPFLIYLKGVPWLLYYIDIVFESGDENLTFSTAANLFLTASTNISLRLKENHDLRKDLIFWSGRD